MNKKEIAQQFTRQILEQNPSTLTTEQVQSIILEIQQLHSRVERSTNYQTGSLKMLGYAIRDIQFKADSLSNHLDQLNETMLQAAVIFRKNQKVSIWHRYWMVILMGILSTLITNIVWIVRG